MSKPLRFPAAADGSRPAGHIHQSRWTPFQLRSSAIPEDGRHIVIPFAVIQHEGVAILGRRR
jgi:hypothetical protein